MIALDLHDAGQVIHVESDHGIRNSVISHCSAKSRPLIPGRWSNHETETATFVGGAIDVVCGYDRSCEIAAGGAVRPGVKHQFRERAASGCARVAEAVLADGALLASAKDELNVSVIDEQIISYLQTTPIMDRQTI